MHYAHMNKKKVWKCHSQVIYSKKTSYFKMKKKNDITYRQYRLQKRKEVIGNNKSELKICCR